MMSSEAATGKNTVFTEHLRATASVTCYYSCKKTEFFQTF